MSINSIGANDLNRKVNTVVGIKKYQQAKKLMSEFDEKFNQQTSELQKESKIDHKIR